MNIAVRFQSRGGNTKAVAEAIANAAGVTAEPIDVPIAEPVDVLIIGGGVYMFALDESLVAFLNAMSTDAVKCIAPFSTGGGMSGTGKIAAIAKSRGIAVCAETLPVKMRLQNYAGKKGSATLTAKQLDMVNVFIERIKVNGNL